MKKKLMMICFFGILLIPNLIGLFFSGARSFENTENRELAPKPVFSLQNIQSFPRQVEDYLNDYAPLRSEIMDAYAVINLELFHSADHLEVILGRDGWLFYKGNESLIDCLGVDPFTEQEMQDILEKLLAVRAAYVDDPENFVFFIAPNKELVYRQYLPSCYESLTDTSKALELVRYIREHSDIKVVYPLEVLQEESREQLLYYKTDTHWNNLAGLIAVQEILKVLEAELTDYHDLTVEYTSTGTGDLGNMFHMPQSYHDDQAAVITGYHDNLESFVLAEESESSMMLTRTEKAPQSQRLLMVRDSFAIAMIPFLMRDFEEGAFISWQNVLKQDLSEYPADVFIYEVVERNLGRVSEELDAILKWKG